PLASGEFAKADFGKSDFGDFGKTDFGKADFGALNKGDAAKPPDFGKADFGKTDFNTQARDFSRADFGKADFATISSTNMNKLPEIKRKQEPGLPHVNPDLLNKPREFDAPQLSHPPQQQQPQQPPPKPAPRPTNSVAIMQQVRASQHRLPELPMQERLHD